MVRGVFKSWKVRIFLLLAVLLILFLWMLKSLLPGSAGDYQITEIPSQGRTLFMRCLNDNGQATGFVRRGKGKERAMVWDVDTSVTTLATPQGYSSIGMDINNGYVVQEAKDISFLLDHRLTRRYLHKALSFETNHFKAYDINNKGQIIVSARKSNYRWYLMTPANLDLPRD